jgi:hypothetical protein
MALERELQRIRDRQVDLDDLCERVEKAADSRPFLLEFGYCVRTIAKGFATQLPTRLHTVEAIKGKLLKDAATHTRNLEKSIDSFVAFLGAPLQALPQIPAELAKFLGRCLQRLDIPHSPFALAIDDSVGMVTVAQAAEHFGLRDVFPELFSIIATDDRVGQFIVFVVPQQLLQRSNALNWCVLAHEAGHASLERSGLVSQRFPHLPRDWRSLSVLAKGGMADALHLMQFNEYVCDEIAVRLVGCSFAWRLLTDFFNLVDVSWATTHPQGDRRVRRAVELSRQHGFHAEADRILSQLEIEVQNVDFAVGTSLVTADEISEVSSQVAASLPGVTRELLARACQEHSPSLTPAEALDELRRGRPVALEDWVVLCLATPDDIIHTKPGLEEVLADAIRLGQVRAEFPLVMKPPVSPP